MYVKQDIDWKDYMRELVLHFLLHGWRANDVDKLNEYHIVQAYKGFPSDPNIPLSPSITSSLLSRREEVIEGLRSELTKEKWIRLGEILDKQVDRHGKPMRKEDCPCRRC